MADPKQPASKRLENIVERPNRFQVVTQTAARPFIILFEMFMKIKEAYPRLSKGLGVVGVIGAIAWGGWQVHSSYDAARQADMAMHRGHIVEAMAGSDYGRSIANLGGKDGAEVYLRVDPETGEAKTVWTRDELLTLYRSMDVKKAEVSRRDDCLIRNWDKRETACGTNAPDPLTRPMR